MYESFYGFRMKPFSLLPNPEFFYLGAMQKTTTALLESSLQNQSGFIVLTGEPGSGKSTVLQRVLDRSTQQVTVGVITHTQEGMGSLLPWIALAFRLEGNGKEPVELYQKFSEFLHRERAREHRVLLVVDEAQNLTAPMLEELRLLSNVMGKQQIMQVLLSGQPSLRTLLQQPEAAQFVERVALECRVDPLTEDDTRAYVHHRLAVAGRTRPLFTDVVCTLIFRATGGIPRRINQLCEMVLTQGVSDQAAWISSKLLMQVARDRVMNGMLPLAQDEACFTATSEQDDAERRQMTAVPVAPAEKPAAPLPAQNIDASEWYERGLVLKKAGQCKNAVEQFERAARDAGYILKAFAQIGLCFKAMGRHEEAVGAFRKALGGMTVTSAEAVQVRYLLGRTLESLGRLTETLDAYRWIRREDPGFRDVAMRIEQLSTGRPMSKKHGAHAEDTWMTQALDQLGRLMGSTR